MKTSGSLIILSFVVLYFVLDPYGFGYTAVSPLYTHVTYIFAHANMLHLAVNVVSFYYTYKILKRLNILRVALVASFVSAILASFMPPCNFVPTVGASALIYAMLGAPLGGVLARRLVVTDKKLFVKTYAFVGVATGIQFLIPDVNMAVHVWAFGVNVVILQIVWGGHTRT